MDIQQVYSELVLRIENLDSLYTQITTNLNEIITWFFVVLFGLLGIIGVALYFLAQSLANKGVETALSNLNIKLSNLQKQLDENVMSIKEVENLKEGYRVIDNEKEYFAPPMRPGVVYRTNERILGDVPIYTVSLSCGYISSNSFIKIDIPFKSIDTLIRSSIFCTGNSKISSSTVRQTASGLQIEVYNDETYSSIDDVPNFYVQIWYTKK